MQSQKIVKYAGIGLIVSALAIGSGFKIYDHNFDHTTDTCLITKIENALPMKIQLNNKETYPMGLFHQKDEMIKDYQDQGIKAICDISQGEVIDTYDYEKVVAKKHTSENGEEIFSIPTGYLLMNDNGQVYGVKPMTKKVDGYIIESTLYKDNDKHGLIKEKGLTLEYKKKD